MANKITQKDINNTVWNACDTFRGTIDPSQYKDYILTMLFLKYVTDIYNEKKAEYIKKYDGNEDRIKRALEREKAFSPIIIDCQDPSFNLKSWNKALYYMCLQTFESIKAYKKAENKKLQLKEPNENSFSNENASHETKIYLMSCKDIMKCTLFFIFDEIENISVKTSPVEHWKNGKDFIPFWQTLRSIFQSETNLLSYLLTTLRYVQLILYI